MKKNLLLSRTKAATSAGLPIDLEFKNSGNYYTIVTAMPHKEKIKETLIYDGSTRPSTATTNGSLSADTNNEGGDGAAIVLAKSNVPFGTSIVSQNNSERQSLEEQQVANKAPDNAQESERQEAKFQNKPKAKTAD